MEFKELAEDIQIPVLGLGTWGIGGGRTPDTSQDEEEIKSLRTGIELGITHIDTAEIYGAGHSEELVGQAIKPYDRKKLFITTKVWPTHLKHDNLITAMKSSLRRLETDYIDLYLIHWPNPEVPLSETMKALEHCAAEGYTKFIGVSNFPKPLLQEAQSHLKDQRLVADQVKYSLEEQAPRRVLLPYCQDNDITLIAYTPLAKGRITQPGNPALDKMAEKYGKTRAQVSLNWLISQKKVVAIPKASKIEHLKENIGAVGWRISDKDLNKLSQQYFTG